MRKKKGWKEVPIGGVLKEKGSSIEYESGSWRSFRPVLDPQKCINCMFCWVYCPDSSVILKGGQVVGFDLKHCKGCGICAKECPPKVQAISMEPESKGPVCG